MAGQPGPEPESSAKSSEPPGITVVIATRNRLTDVARAIETCLAQDLGDLGSEILVLDDNSSDGTAEELEQKFPQITVLRHETRRERLVLRNKGYRLARYPFVLVLDDDCYFTDARVLSRSYDEFAKYSSLAVVGLPMVEPSRPRNFMPREPESGEEIGSFLAGASVFRKQAVLSVGGYRELLVHHEEERDLAYRLLNAGWRFSYLGGPAIVHTVSAQRDRGQSDIDGIRNIILVSFLNLPWHLFVFRAAVNSINILRYQWRPSSTYSKLKGLAAGFVCCWTWRKHRQPISKEAYLRNRKLPSHGARELKNDNLAPLKRSVEGPISESG